MKRSLIRFGLVGGLLALLYGQLLLWRDPLVGWALFLGYLAVHQHVWQDIFARAFRMKRGRSVTVAFALFATVMLFGFVGGVFVVWYTLTPFFVWLSYVATSVLTGLLSFFVRIDGKKTVPGVSSGRQWKKIPRDWKVFRGYHIVSLLYVLLSALLVGLFFVSKSDAVLMSPWQTLSSAILPMWFAATAILGLLLFSKMKIKTLLFFVVVHSMVAHLYLPMAHAFPWGGDVWRHVAVEQKIISGDLQLPVIAGPEAKWREVFGADIPEALVIPHKYIYGQFWGTSIMLAETLQVDLLVLNIWLLPVLWSLVLPFIFFYLGKILFGSWRNGLWLAWLSLLLFPFQALGSLTLPVSLGALVFFFVLTLWLHYLQSGRRAARRVALLFAGFMIFGYTLFALLMWFVIIASFCLRHGTRIRRRLFRWPSVVLLIAASMLFFPVLELVAGISVWPEQIDIVAQAKQVIGQFSGWYYVSGIRPHDILSGNIFFNHTPASAFVSTLFTDWRWHVPFALALLFVLAGYGIYNMIREEDSVAWRTVGLVGVAVFFGYIINWFFLTGDRSFVRRLDVLLGFFVLLFFLRGFFAVRDRAGGNGVKKKRAAIVVAVGLLAWFGTTAYATGPDMRVVSLDEHHAAARAFAVLGDQAPPCVLADTWILLPLEAHSAGRVVGGGFPIDSQFGQVERTALFADMVREPSQEALTDIHQLTGATTCVFVVQASAFDEEKRGILNDIADVEPQEIQDFLIWELPLKKSGESDSV